MGNGTVETCDVEPSLYPDITDLNPSDSNNGVQVCSPITGRSGVEARPA